eukprot:RCo052310
MDPLAVVKDPDMLPLLLKVELCLGEIEGEGDREGEIDPLPLGNEGDVVQLADDGVTDKVTDGETVALGSMLSETDGEGLGDGLWEGLELSVRVGEGELEDLFVKVGEAAVERVKERVFARVKVDVEDNEAVRVPVRLGVFIEVHVNVSVASLVTVREALQDRVSQSVEDKVRVSVSLANVSVSVEVLEVVHVTMELKVTEADGTFVRDGVPAWDKVGEILGVSEGVGGGLREGVGEKLPVGFKVSLVVDVHVKL